MSTEELKMVLEALSNAGESGIQAFLIWKLIDSLALLLTVLAVIVGGWVIARTIVTYNLESDRAWMYLDSLVERLRLLEKSKYISDSRYSYPETMEYIHQILNAYYAEKNARKNP